MLSQLEGLDRSGPHFNKKVIFSYIEFPIRAMKRSWQNFQFCDNYITKIRKKLDFVGCMLFITEQRIFLWIFLDFFWHHEHRFCIGDQNTLLPCISCKTWVSVLMQKYFFMSWRNYVSWCHGPRQLFIRRHQASLAPISGGLVEKQTDKYHISDTTGVDSSHSSENKRRNPIWYS